MDAISPVFLQFYWTTAKPSTLANETVNGEGTVFRYDFGRGPVVTKFGTDITIPVADDGKR